MKNLSAQARPYAKAIFQLAQTNQAVEMWSETLTFWSIIITNTEIQDLLSHPKITQKQKGEILINIGKTKLHTDTQPLIRLLAHYNRLAVLPEIARQYERLRQDQEHTKEAMLVSAFPITEEEKKRFIKVLEGYFQQKVLLSFQVDAALIGGAIIQTQEGIIDGSLRGKLTQLRSVLSKN